MSMRELRTGENLRFMARVTEFEGKLHVAFDPSISGLNVRDLDRLVEGLKMILEDVKKMPDLEADPMAGEHRSYNGKPGDPWRKGSGEGS